MTKMSYGGEDYVIASIAANDPVAIKSLSVLEKNKEIPNEIKRIKSLGAGKPPPYPSGLSKEIIFSFSNKKNYLNIKSLDNLDRFIRYVRDAYARGTRGDFENYTDKQINDFIEKTFLRDSASYYFVKGITFIKCPIDLQPVLFFRKSINLNYFMVSDMQEYIDAQKYMSEEDVYEEFINAALDPICRPYRPEDFSDREKVAFQQKWQQILYQHLIWHRDLTQAHMTSQSITFLTIANNQHFPTEMSHLIVHKLIESYR